jgi:tRNA(fMet)-specific endonuclease VapC
MVIVDSSVFIALERLGVTLEATADVAPDEEVALAAITASELLVGVHLAETTERAVRRQAYVEIILASVPVISFDLQVARVHARLSADLAQRGQTIGAHDLMIASTAIACSGSVLTANVREFVHVPGLSVRRVTGPPKS